MPTFSPKPSVHPWSSSALTSAGRAMPGCSMERSSAAPTTLRSRRLSPTTLLPPASWEGMCPPALEPQVHVIQLTYWRRGGK